MIEFLSCSGKPTLETTLNQVQLVRAFRPFEEKGEHGPLYLQSVGPTDIMNITQGVKSGTDLP